MGPLKLEFILQVYSIFIQNTDVLHYCFVKGVVSQCTFHTLRGCREFVREDLTLRT